MKKLFLLLSILAFAFVSNAQPVCPTGQLPQNAKWSFNFSQCMKDSLYMTYLDTSKIMYIDANGVVTTISYAALLDSLNVPVITPHGNQWAIQLNDSGQFGSSENFKYDEDEGVFYITDFNGDTLFSVNTQTRETRSRGTLSLNLPDSTGAIIDGNGNMVADSINWAWKGNGWYLLNRYSAPAATGALLITGTLSTTSRVVHTTISNTPTQAPTYQFFRARGSLETPTTVTSGTRLGIVNFGGYNGVSYTTNGAIITAFSDATWSGNSIPSYLTFTTSDADAQQRSMVYTRKGTLSIGNVGAGEADTNYMLNVTGASLTGAQTFGAVNILQTWNTSGNPTGIFANFTNTASGASTNIIDLRVSNVSRFTVSKAGALTGLATIQTSSVGIFGTGGTVIGDGSSMLYQNSTANGFLRAVSAGNWSLSSVNFLSLGGITSSFPAFQREGTAIRLRLADTSGFAQLQTGTLSVNGVPNASAAVTITSTTQGFLPPVMTATQASAISSPATGLMLYVTDTNGTFTSTGWWGYNGSTWEKLNN